MCSVWKGNPGQCPELIPWTSLWVNKRRCLWFEANITVMGEVINANKTGTCCNTCQSVAKTMTHALWVETWAEWRTSFTTVACAWKNHPQSHQSKHYSCETKWLQIRVAWVSWFLTPNLLCKRVQLHTGPREVRTAALAADLTSQSNDQSPAFSKEKTDIHARFLSPWGHLEAQASPDIKRW